MSALRHHLEQDGFLLLRGILQRSTVLRARKRVLNHLHVEKVSTSQHIIVLILNFQHAIRPNTALDEGIIAFDDDGKYMIGWTVDAVSGGVQNHTEDPAPWAIVGNSDEVASIYRGTELSEFYSKLFEKDCQIASNCKKPADC
jgi:hypothetical protein